MTEFAQDTVKPNADNPAVPRVLHWLPAAFLLAVVGLGAVATVASPGFREGQPGKDIIKGEWMLAWEKNLDAKVPWRDPSVNLWGGTNYRLFDEARDGALVGKNGWLFTTEEYQTAAGDTAEIQNKVRYITQVRDELAKEGAKLVVALIPAKARVYDDELRAAQPAQWRPVYDQMRAALTGAGIPTPDLATAFAQARRPGQNLFLHTDTHWTPRGAQVAAKTLVPAIQATGAELPSASYTAKVKPEISRSGDLLRYVPVARGGPQPDFVSEPEYTRTDDGGGGLLGDETLAVTLVGTSYSAETKDNVWHFGGALSQALGSEVLNAAQEGKGPIVPMREYLKSQDRQDNPPQVVVWEIPERFLRVIYPEESEK